MSPSEPRFPKALVFVDGQNLYRGAKEAFGYHYPNYDVQALSEKLCRKYGWELNGIYFYTGIPDDSDDVFWHHFWIAKTGAMGRKGIRIFTRPLRYRTKEFRLPDGAIQTIRVGQEKGVDVRLALDVVRAARNRECDVALVISQDQDLSEAADEVRLIAREQNRWIKIASAFPFSPALRNRRGINHTDWIRMDRPFYDECLDKRDYRSPSPRTRRAI